MLFVTMKLRATQFSDRKNPRTCNYCAEKRNPRRRHHRETNVLNGNKTFQKGKEEKATLNTI